MHSMTRSPQQHGDAPGDVRSDERVDQLVDEEQKKTFPPVDTCAFDNLPDNQKALAIPLSTKCRKKEGCTHLAVDRNRGLCQYHSLAFSEAGITIAKKNKAASLCLGPTFVRWKKGVKNLCCCGRDLCKAIGYPNEGVVPFNKSVREEWLRAAGIDGQTAAKIRITKESRLAYWHFPEIHREFVQGKWRLRKDIPRPFHDTYGSVWNCGGVPIVPLKEFIESQIKVRDSMAPALMPLPPPLSPTATETTPTPTTEAAIPTVATAAKSPKRPLPASTDATSTSKKKPKKEELQSAAKVVLRNSSDMSAIIVMLRKKNTTLRKENKELQDAHDTLMAKQEECKLSLQHAHQECQERTAQCASLRAELDEALALLGRTKEILPAITNLDTNEDDPVITNPDTNEDIHPVSASVTSEEADMPS